MGEVNRQEVIYLIELYGLLQKHIKHFRIKEGVSVHRNCLFDKELSITWYGTKRTWVSELHKDLASKPLKFRITTETHNEPHCSGVDYVLKIHNVRPSVLVVLDEVMKEERSALISPFMLHLSERALKLKWKNHSAEMDE